MEEEGWIGDNASLPPPPPLLPVFVRLILPLEPLLLLLPERLNMEGSRVLPSEFELWPSGGCSV